MRKIVLAAVSLLFVLSFISAQETWINAEKSPVKFFFETEQGITLR
ncbi:MAG: hypothetical protein H8D65_02015 [Spirochaetes bacterium]|nr:hypothetical protein [Spirochaetota bacterium]MBL7006082.1 hypothetical protein [Spirochaetia bacterium]